MMDRRRRVEVRKSHGKRKVETVWVSLGVSYVVLLQIGTVWIFLLPLLHDFLCSSV